MTGERKTGKKERGKDREAAEQAGKSEGRTNGREEGRKKGRGKGGSEGRREAGREGGREEGRKGGGREAVNTGKFRPAVFMKSKAQPTHLFFGPRAFFRLRGLYADWYTLQTRPSSRTVSYFTQA